ncbi:hypothetical protein EDD21DRAFT_355979 [Dissophora ornata]|nr:hypothetical protein EDD21DRAFT_355979 [Dissophora ornata]
MIVYVKSHRSPGNKETSLVLLTLQTRSLVMDMGVDDREAGQGSACGKVVSSHLPVPPMNRSPICPKQQPSLIPIMFTGDAGTGSATKTRPDGVSEKMHRE